MSTPPEVSVILPLHQGRATVDGAMASVLAQSGPALELIVVDDGSTDGGADVARAWGDPRVRVVVQARAGVSAARNRGVAEARAGLVAFIDADDLWLPGHLTRLAALAAEHPEATVIAARYFLEDAAGARRPALVPGFPRGFTGRLPDYPSALLRGDPPFCTISALVRREALVAVCGFPASAPAGEDLLTFFKLGLLGPIAWTDACSAVYRAPQPGERPVRTPPEEDPLAEEAARFAQGRSAADRAALRRFLAYWYRVRAVTFLAHGMCAEARGFAVRSLRSRAGLRAAAIAAATLLPATLGRRALAAGRRILASARGRGRVT